MLLLGSARGIDGHSNLGVEMKKENYSWLMDLSDLVAVSSLPKREQSYIYYAERTGKIEVHRLNHLWPHRFVQLTELANLLDKRDMKKLKNKDRKKKPDLAEIRAQANGHSIGATRSFFIIVTNNISDVDIVFVFVIRKICCPP